VVLKVSGRFNPQSISNVASPLAIVNIVQTVDLINTATKTDKAYSSTGSLITSSQVISG